MKQPGDERQQLAQRLDHEHPVERGFVDTGESLAMHGMRGLDLRQAVARILKCL
jgi:hypothetical protein